jgi:hypothetical protein
VGQRDRDARLDTLLDLDGEVFVVDPKGWVKFEARRVPPTPERPHGLEYSLSLHSPERERLVGFDNAHRMRRSAGLGGNAKGAYDHKHRLRSVRAYGYRDAATLLADFWAEVDGILKERGILP